MHMEDDIKSLVKQTKRLLLQCAFNEIETELDCLDWIPTEMPSITIDDVVYTIKKGWNHEEP